MSAKTMLLVASLLGAAGVGLGAYGAHGLRTQVESWGLEAAEQARRLDTWEVATRYLMYHALALLGLGLLTLQQPGNPWWSWTGKLWLGGVLVFSGLLYVLVLTGLKVLGAIVPLGGLALIAGWLSLATGVCLNPPEVRQETNSPAAAGTAAGEVPKVVVELDRTKA